MFGWDEVKRQANIVKHGLDFVDAREIFDGRPMLSAASARDNEERFVTIARLQGRFVTIVWTWREPVRRIFSLRRARDAETRAYRQLYGG
jgi:uncharacterized protein